MLLLLYSLYLIDDQINKSCRCLLTVTPPPQKRKKQNKKKPLTFFSICFSLSPLHMHTCMEETHLLPTPLLYDQAVNAVMYELLYS